MNQQQRNAWIGAAKEQILRNAGAPDGCETDLMELYGECVNSPENRIQAFYGRYVRDDQLIEAQASKLLTGREYNIRERLLEGYFEELEGQGKDLQLVLKLNTLATRSQVGRKEQLLASVYHNMSRLAGRSETELTGLLGGLIQANYEREMFDIQSIGGVVWDVPETDERLLKQISSYPWSGKQYSKALWDNTDQLAALTHRKLTLGFMSGASVDKIAKEIDDVMGKGRYAVQRPVWTEASYLANQGQLLAHQDVGMAKYHFLGGDCEICQRLNGQMFELSDVHTGGNLLPIHPNCKCTTVAAYDIPIFKQHQGNPLGGNPKFEEWRKGHMEGADQVESGPGQEPAKKGIFTSLEERREATGLLQPYAPKVKVTGEVNQASYKKAAAEPEQQLAKAPFQKLDEITIFDSRDAPGEIGSTVGEQLRMGAALMNAPEKYYGRSVLNWTKRIETSTGKLRTRLNEGASEAIREAYDRQMELKRHSRGNVLCNGREIAYVVQHEMMYTIVSEIGMRGDRGLKECYNGATKSGDIYDISYRASENRREFICEAAVMYKNGGPVPEYIKRLVKECRSYEA